MIYFLFIIIIIICLSYMIYNTRCGIKKIDEITIQLTSQREYTAQLVRLYGLMQQGKRIADFVRDKDIHSLSLYGCSQLGQYIADELSDTVQIKYFLDTNTALLGKQYAGIEVIMPYSKEDLGEAVLITVLRDSDTSIKQKLTMWNDSIEVYTLRDIISYLTLIT